MIVLHVITLNILKWGKSYNSLRSAHKDSIFTHNAYLPDYLTFYSSFSFVTVSAEEEKTMEEFE